MLRRIPPSPVTTFGLIVVLIVLAPRANALLPPRLARDPGSVDSCTRMQAMLLGVQIWGIKPVTFSDRHLICQIQITCDIEYFVFRHRARFKQQTNIWLIFQWGKDVSFKLLELIRNRYNLSFWESCGNLVSSLACTWHGWCNSQSQFVN